MHYLKPRLASHSFVETDPETTTPSASDQTSKTSSPNESPSSQLDQYFAYFCLMIEIFSYILLATNVTPTSFILLSATLTLGAPAMPLLHSLALSLLPDKREAGRLFGGLGVLHTIGASLISHILFGSLFSATVGSYAPSVFALAAGILVLGLICLVMVRSPVKVAVGEGTT
jgi:hypothetical protein